MKRAEPHADPLASPQAAPATAPLSRRLSADLRTDHAGETGAVWIYKGILATSRDAGVRAFAARHLQTEQAHLAQIESLLPVADRSRLLPVWRVAGWATGALPAIAGPGAVYATIEAVETFVDLHYQEQIEWLAQTGFAPQCAAILKACQADEVAHRDEAGALAPARGPVARLWSKLVAGGSRAAVAAARIL